MDEDSDDGYTNEENYYTFLNVPKNATQEQINTAYRSLSRMYHPDKHVNNDKKTQAELMFNRVKKAYEILSDPHKRVIYDCLGTKGLETEGWEIVQRTRTPAEIRAEYEQLAREREERQLQQKTNPRGNITVNINATDLFDSYEIDDIEYSQFSLTNIEVSGMSISQSVEAPITTQDTVTLSGNLNSHNGVGNGGFVISGRRLVNKGWLEMDIGGGSGPSIAFKGSKNLTSRVFCSGGVNMSFRSNGVIPGLVGTLAVQLNKHTIGYLTYTAGIQSSMSTVIERTTEYNHMLCNVTIGIPHCFVYASYTRKLDEWKMKVRVATKIGTFGYLVEYGTDLRLSKYSTVGATVTLGVPSGVTLKIRVTRSTQSFIFPIHLSEEMIPSAVFYATVTPVISWLLIKQLIIEPLNRAKKKRELEKARDLNKSRMTAKQKEATAAVDLMTSMHERIRREEEEKDGLVIVQALYGNLRDSDIDDEPQITSTIIDVTIPVQCLVKDSKLILHNINKSELPGFYDPCAGDDKYLYIEYIYRNNSSSVKVSDNELLKLPPDDIS